MQRILDAFVWLFFAAIAYLIAVEALGPWLDLPGAGNIGFTLVFVFFALAHCLRCEGLRRTGAFFAASAVISFAMEEIGVRTGLIFGPYHYSDMLGAKLGHVPVLIPLAWFMMIYPSWLTARALMRGIDTRSPAGIAALALVAATVMTAWDVLMDPGMSASGNWVWEQGGAYFGVPVHNYFGWMLTTFLVYCAAGILWHTARRAAVPEGSLLAALPVVIYAEFAVRYVTAGRNPILKVVAFFVMALPGFLALAQTWLPRERREPLPASAD
ncbi:MAG TPA: carotenoid biosynthesis protein [Terracidiphilus sp.]|nr:carotenoid biosynthesis protein [Terracidiphilus sp.]